MEVVNDPASAYRLFGAALVRKAERILRNREDAIDLVHSLFSDLVSKWNIDMDLPYLYRAVTNRCLNQLRDHSNRARLLQRQGSVVAPQGRVRCDEEVLGLNLIVRLADVLDDQQMETLVCRFVDDMSQEEIATHLGVSRKTVGKRIDEIRTAVSNMLGGDHKPGQHAPADRGAR